MVTVALWVMLVVYAIRSLVALVTAFGSGKGAKRVGAVFALPLLVWLGYSVYLVLTQGYTP